MPPKAKDLQGRLDAKTVRDGDCILWTGAKTPNGYGVMGAGRGSDVDYTHRISYRLAHGPIADGLHIDHLCSNRACVNPAHLEAVTQAENNRRANTKRAARTTHCKRGHEFTPQNTGQQAHNRGRKCLACSQIYYRARLQGLTVAAYLQNEGQAA